MKHIKIYEEYTDDELRDLMGDLSSVGHHKVQFDVELHLVVTDGRKIPH